jgi:hypothetical protein
MKLTGDLKALESSIRIYREALRFIIPIVDAHWDEIKNFKYIHQRMARIEKLIHSTKKIKLNITLMKDFQSSLRIYVELHSIVHLESSPLIVVILQIGKRNQKDKFHN